MRRAIFPGSFNPFTIGHDDIVRRGLSLFDEIVIGVGHNSSKPSDETAERVEAIRQIYTNEPRVKVESFDSLTVDFARAKQANFILRGIRSVKDFEYERDMAEANKQLGDIETILIYAQPHLAHVSSSLVRELQSYGKDVSKWIAK